jgi:hypothetical protein
MATLAEPVLRWSRPRFAAPSVILSVAAAVAALIQSLFLPIDCDVSWLITVNEKVLAGQRLYSDIIEVNPPASVWLYTAPVWLAHQLQLRPEALVVAFFIAAALISCAVTLRITGRLPKPPHQLAFCAALAFATLLLPLGNFAQREHAAVLLAIPALAGMAAIADRRPLSLGWSVTVGAAAGAVVALKPHFALAIAPALAFACWRARSLRTALPLAFAAAAIVALYAAAILILTPDYLRLLPILAKVYLPLRGKLTVLVLGPAVIVPLALYALAFALRPRRLSSFAAVLLLGSAGFAASALIQGKGYLNHALPGMALAFIAVTVVAFERSVDPRRRYLVLSATAVLAALELYAMASIQPIEGLAQTVDRVAPSHPSVITLGPELRTGHPLVRNIDGRWAGSRAGLFIAGGVYQRIRDTKDRDPRLLRWYREDLQSFADDVRRERPDVILVDARPGLEWLRREPIIARAIAPYRPAARADDIEVWVRRS